MTDKTERDALVAKLDRVVSSMRRDDESAVWWIKDVREVIEALAAQPAPPAASVDVEGLRELADSMEHDGHVIRIGRNWMSPCAHYAPRLRALIDSAGGAKGITGSVSPQMRDASAASPTMSEKPAEGEGVDEAWMVKARELYGRCAVFPETTADGMTALLELRNHVEKILATGEQP